MGASVLVAVPLFKGRHWIWAHPTGNVTGLETASYLPGTNTIWCVCVCNVQAQLSSLREGPCITAREDAGVQEPSL